MARRPGLLSSIDRMPRPRTQVWVVAGAGLYEAQLRVAAVAAAAVAAAAVAAARQRAGPGRSDTLVAFANICAAEAIVPATPYSQTFAPDGSNQQSRLQKAAVRVRTQSAAVGVLRGGDRANDPKS